MAQNFNNILSFIVSLDKTLILEELNYFLCLYLRMLEKVIPLGLLVPLVYDY